MKDDVRTRNDFRQPIRLLVQVELDDLQTRVSARSFQEPPVTGGEVVDHGGTMPVSQQTLGHM